MMHQMKKMPRILVIDDDAPLRSLLREALEQNGFSVEEQSNGLLGLRAYKLLPADVVLTDIVMPDKEGLETIRDFRRSFPDAKIIAMSGGLTTSNLDPLPLAAQFGARHTLRKPFSIKELLSALAMVLESR